MKKATWLVNFIFLALSAFAQNNDGKKIELQLKERTSFYTVTNRYELLTDTVYHADQGFRVFSGYDIETAEDGKEYVIFRYPDWNGKNQKEIENNPPQPNTPQSSNKQPVHTDITGKNGLRLAMLKTEFDKLTLENKFEDVYSLKWKHSTSLASGFLTVPFKFRPKQDSVNFNMTTDITLGAYIGIKKRISRKGNNHIVIPATLGLSYINVGNNQTSNVNTKGSSSVVPGWSWSTGLVFDLNGVNVGLILGQDYASGVGENWLYNKKMWYSFSIGYSFFGKR